MNFNGSDVTLAYESYAFGSTFDIPRGINDPTSEGYRYSFQGQESDPEIKGEGNSINFKYRIHDPRLGRFFSIDPLAAEYSYNSPYAFSENRVIDGVELEGLEVQLVSEEQNAGSAATSGLGFSDVSIVQAVQAGQPTNLNITATGNGNSLAQANQVLNVTKDQNGVIQDPTPNNGQSDISQAANSLTPIQARVLSIGTTRNFQTGTVNITNNNSSTQSNPGQPQPQQLNVVASSNTAANTTLQVTSARVASGRVTSTNGAGAATVFNPATANPATAVGRIVNLSNGLNTNNFTNLIIDVTFNTNAANGYTNAVVANLQNNGFTVNTQFNNGQNNSTNFSFNLFLTR